ncbi:radical SAM protein [Streptomyces sp. NBC_01803]|uniref:radical SAM protein n=1 Tax=Streptomyces sp. NBC_01803 TaxID=2975946 RepID=UPI002DDBE04F|nr:radical SAM protein [Streptomyces sp. NBC_01803]WSA47664.1 radical SAM protein [Streptomyces sp. NBC_01803]
MDAPSVSHIRKVASRCSLNCTYCYVYNKADTTYEARPRIMDPKTARAALGRITAYAARHRVPEAIIALHGGEPLLVGKPWMARFLEDVRYATPDGLRLSLTVQTNGTLLAPERIELFDRHGVQIGVSLDGPAAWKVSSTSRSTACCTCWSSGPPWARGDRLFDPRPSVRSPWTGRLLPIRPFLQATFVWYGLLHFWSLALAAGAFPTARAEERRETARRGFLRTPLAELMTPCRPHLSDDVAETITTLQNRATATH